MLIADQHTAYPLDRQLFLQNFFEHADTFGDVDAHEVHEHHATLLAIKTCDIATLRRMLHAMCSEYGDSYIYLICLHGRFLLRETHALFQSLKAFDVSVSFFHHTLERGYAAEVMVGHRAPRRVNVAA